jgi:hypothetical protein
MTHLKVMWDTQGFTPQMIGDMTRKEFDNCPLPYYMKVSMLKEYFKLNR